MTAKNAATKATNETAKVTVTVTDDRGVTFAKKFCAKGTKISCTPGQAKILQGQRVIDAEV